MRGCQRRATASYCVWTRTNGTSYGADRAGDGRVAREKSLQDQDAGDASDPDFAVLQSGAVELSYAGGGVDGGGA